MSNLEESNEELDLDQAVIEVRRIVKSVGKMDVLAPDSNVGKDLISIAKTMLTLEKAVYREYESGSQKEG